MAHVGTSQLHIFSTKKVLPEGVGASQVTLISTVHADHVFPIIWILMLEKTKENCCKILREGLNHFKATLSPSEVYSDFDDEILNAAIEAFPGALNKGTFISHCIIMIDTANKLNLDLADESSLLIFCKLVALSLLPPEKIAEAFRWVVSSMDNIQYEKFQLVLEHYRENWLVGVKPENYSFFGNAGALLKNSDLIIKNAANQLRNDKKIRSFVERVLSIHHQCHFHLNNLITKKKINWTTNKLKNTLSDKKQCPLIEHCWEKMKNDTITVEEFLKKIGTTLKSVVRNLKFPGVHLPLNFKLVVSSNVQPTVPEIQEIIRIPNNTLIEEANTADLRVFHSDVHNRNEDEFQPDLEIYELQNVESDNDDELQPGLIDEEAENPPRAATPVDYPTTNVGTHNELHPIERVDNEIQNLPRVITPADHPATNAGTRDELHPIGSVDNELQNLLRVITPADHPATNAGTRDELHPIGRVDNEIQNPPRVLTPADHPATNVRTHNELHPIESVDNELQNLLRVITPADHPATNAGIRDELHPIGRVDNEIQNPPRVLTPADHPATNAGTHDELHSIGRVDNEFQRPSRAVTPVQYHAAVEVDSSELQPADLAIIDIEDDVMEEFWIDKSILPEEISPEETIEAVGKQRIENPGGRERPEEEYRASEKCSVCLVNEPNMYYDPCGHKAVCYDSNLKLVNGSVKEKTIFICVICRSQVINVNRGD